ncbi:unnamed protein product [Orchesella dallaii]|uniref:SET domain-containing protein n=1 Tax=Orchesella dallaii TaxID=48710 RepID=A0ABP1QS40_9HEXA
MDPSLKTGDSLQHRCGHCKRAIQVSSTEFPCSNCKKVFYCSEAHRKSHASKHEKSGCFPAIIHSNSECGRYWVASRHIAVDEVIYMEKASVLAPNIPTMSHLYPTCLGCCRGTNTTYRCSKCSWPVCNKRCEKLGSHSMNECKIFRKNEVQPNCRPQYYFFIQFLRALLLKEKDPKGFEELMQLESHIQARMKVKDEVLMFKSFYKFLTEECNMDYELDVVNHIVGVNRVNCYSGDALINGKKRFCTAVFPKLSLINHNCRPNTRTILHEKDGGLYMELRSSMDIEEGEEISQQYISSTKGTFLRRENLYEDWFFHCCCERCSDSTEFNSFFSAIKCVNCSEGYLLPKNPLESDSPWVCVQISFQMLTPETGCGYSRTSENVKRLTDDIDARIKLAQQSPKALERILVELSSHSLHPNHYLLIDIKFNVLDEIVRKLNYVKENGTCFGNVDDDDLLKAVEYAKSILGVIRMICSSRSYCIGIILYFLACTLMELRTRKVPTKFTDAQVEKVVKEAWTILHVESEGSSYREMVKCLEDRSLVLDVENLSLRVQA